MASILDLQQRFLRTAGEIMLREIAVRVASKSIRASLNLSFEEDRVAVRTPYYFAVILERGRGPIFARRGGWLAYYPNPRLDPRLAGGRPVRFRDAKNLTFPPAVFRDEVKSGRLILTKRIGPKAGDFAFRKGGEATKKQVKGVAKREFDIATRAFFDTLPKLGGVVRLPI